MIYYDQMMREVRLDKPPSRIVCLVPSITELLCDLGLEEQIVGITKFCVHPEHVFKSKPRVGGTKKIKHEVIDRLQPDLVIANKEENLESDIKILEQKFPVWVSDIKNLEHTIDMIGKLGEITSSQKKALQIISRIEESFKSIQPLSGEKTLYLVWKDPFMAAGTETFIDDMLQRCGFANVLPPGSRYPQLSPGEMAELNPTWVLLSSEPYPFKEKNIEELKSILPEANVQLVDGEFFSWYGSRLIQSPAYFNSLIHNMKRQKKGAAYEH